MEAALALAEQWPVPLASIWNAGYEPLAQRGAERGCSVILTGMGGDEWLTVTPCLSADLMKALDVRGLFRHVRALQRSYPNPAAQLLGAALWRFGARPLIVSMLPRIAPRWFTQTRVRRVVKSTPSWLAPDPSLRKSIDDRIEASLPPANPSHGFYWAEAESIFEHPVISIDLEEQYELGRRTGVRVRHPYWDVDLVEFLMRTPWDLLNGKGKSKGLVREAMASRFPALGFERQKKVSALTYYRQLLMTEMPALWRATGGARALGALGIVNAGTLDVSVERMFAEADTVGLSRVWEVLRLERWVRAQC